MSFRELKDEEGRIDSSVTGSYLKDQQDFFLILNS